MRRRLGFLLCAAFCAAAGLWLRGTGPAWPSFVASYFPDALWAMLVYCGFGMLLAKRPRVLAACALAFSFAVEASQLYHAPWIDALRTTALGGLILGWGFLWSDLACYAAGVAVCFALDSLLQRRKIGL